jgi:hypothetical protein
MTRNVTDIIDGLRNTYRASQTSEVACEARALIAHIDRMEETLRTVERWANHHARKPSTTAAEALCVIQHHPVIRAITAGYADGVIPSTPDPYAEIERLKCALRMAVTQNECDMLPTGEELRKCRKYLGDGND